MAQPRQHSRLIALAEAYSNYAQSSFASVDTQTHLLLQYHHCCYLTLLSYKASLDIPGLTPKQEMVSRLGLGQALSDYTTDLSEAEFVIERALLKASQDDTLDNYLFKAYELLIRITSTRSRWLAQLLLKRAITDAEKKNRTEWLYQYNFLAAEIAESPAYCFKVIADTAKRNGDTDLRLLALAESTRLAVGGSDSRSSTTQIEDLEREINYVPFVDRMGSDVKENVEMASVRKESGIRAYILVVLLIAKTVYNIRHADAASSARSLKEVHILADENSKEDGLFEIDVNICADRLLYKAPTQRQILEFSFLLSCIVHRDPVGVNPPSLAYASIGVELINEDDTRPAVHRSTTSEREKTQASRANIQLALKCSAAQVHIMRREMEDARAQLSKMVRLAREHTLTIIWAPWLLLLEGFILQASYEQVTAKRYYEAVAMLCGDKGSSYNYLFSLNEKYMGDLQNEEMELSAKLSSVTQDVAMKHEVNETIKIVLERVKFSQCPSSVRALAEMVEGMLSSGSITRKKKSLSQSFRLSSISDDRYIRAFLFVMLSEVFGHSHEDQALQMIQTGYAISRKMGKVDQATARNFGMPFLNVIYSQSLENHYKRSNMKAELTKQEAYTKFYRKCCDSIADAGYDKSVQFSA